MSKTVEITTWKKVKQKIISLNPLIGSEMDKIPGVDGFKVIRVEYPFGAPIIRKGLFHLNIDGDYINYKNSAIPHEIRDLLNYNWLGIPFGMVTHNTFEAHIDVPSHVIPLRLLQAGNTFSLLTIFEHKGASHHIVGAQSATSGCRSLITLPSIGHQQYNERLAKRYHLEEPIVPKDLFQQWRLFNELANSRSFRSQWNSELIFFSHDFYESLDKQLGLKNNLLSYAWQANAFQRNYNMYELLFSSFVEECLSLSTRNSASVIETVKHLIKLALRQVPGFAPATTEIAGPVTGFTKALLDVYRIRFYLPIFMQLAPYDGNKPIYYSLHKHTFLHTIPQNGNSNNKTIKEMAAIKSIIEEFRNYVLGHKSPFSLKSTALYKMLKEVEFEFYHPHGKEAGLNHDIESIAKEDKRFMKLISKLPIEKDLKFPVKSIFFNGCIRVRPTHTKS